jgi:type II secretory pathway pseudopilin PulG
MQAQLIFRNGKAGLSHAPSSPAFTLLELLVVIATIAILATLLLAELRRAKAAALSAACKSNLRQLGLGLELYLNDFKKYPMAYPAFGDPSETPQTWLSKTCYYGLLPYCGNQPKLFECPASHYAETLSWVGDFWAGPTWAGYGYNSGGTDKNVPKTMNSAGPTLGLGWHSPMPESSVLVPSDMIAMGDSSFGDILGFGWPGWCEAGFHSWRSNGVFCDNHVETSRSDLGKEPFPGTAFSRYKPDASHAKRWNNDNQPHPETWPAN